MPEQEVILLEKLVCAIRKDGLMETEVLKVRKPKPCIQSNAPGTLRSFQNLETFRKEGRAVGRAFGAAFK